MHRGRRRAHGIALGAVLLLMTAGRLGAVEPYPLVEDFGSGRLDPSRWERTTAGDFREWSVEVVDAPGPARPASSPVYRLRLRADTQGTRDDTVKHLGARFTQPIPFREGREIAVQLDWADQANGSYLTAAVVLSPHATQGNPLDTPDWLKVAYVGVPPGRNARMLVELRAHGRDDSVETEGWPETRREGRRIGVQEIKLRVRSRSIEVWEGERLVWTSMQALSFETGYLYLQMSSHSNYAARSIYFTRVRID